MSEQSCNSTEGGPLFPHNLNTWGNHYSLTTNFPRCLRLSMVRILFRRASHPKITPPPSASRAHLSMVLREESSVMFPGPKENYVRQKSIARKMDFQNHCFHWFMQSDLPHIGSHKSVVLKGRYKRWKLHWRFFIAQALPLLGPHWPLSTLPLISRTLAANTLTGFPLCQKHCSLALSICLSNICQTQTRFPLYRFHYPTSSCSLFRFSLSKIWI